YVDSSIAATPGECRWTSQSLVAFSSLARCDQLRGPLPERVQGSGDCANCFHGRMTSAASSLTSPNMRASHLEDFYQFLRFPSVSTDDQYAEKVTECGHWLVEKLTKIGLSARLCPTPGHPVVWAQNQHKPGRRTVLIYGHYDVQPPDPVRLWDSPPFEPILKNGYVFARGATDNKGQI